MKQLSLGVLSDLVKPFDYDPLLERKMNDMAVLLKKLGMPTLGDFLRLPMAGLSSRFGAEALTAHRVLKEGFEPPWPTLTWPEKIIEETDLEVQEIFVPLETLEPLLFLLRGIISRVVARLHGRNERAVSVRLEFESRRVYLGAPSSGQTGGGFRGAAGREAAATATEAEAVRGCTAGAGDSKARMAEERASPEGATGRSPSQTLRRNDEELGSLSGEEYFERETPPHFQKREWDFNFPVPQKSFDTIFSILREKIYFELRKTPLEAPVTVVRLTVVETAPGAARQPFTHSAILPPMATSPFQPHVTGLECGSCRARADLSAPRCVCPSCGKPVL
ncbi:MAG: hypothetical protein ABL958_13450, partial [Bdellovibrionia bacterium]